LPITAEQVIAGDAKLRRMMFGTKNETIAREVEELEFKL
jgi:hypothetical protein